MGRWQTAESRAEALERALERLAEAEAPASGAGQEERLEPEDAMTMAVDHVAHHTGYAPEAEVEEAGVAGRGAVGAFYAAAEATAASTKEAELSAAEAVRRRATWGRAAGATRVAVEAAAAEEELSAAEAAEQAKGGLTHVFAHLQRCGC